MIMKCWNCGFEMETPERQKLSFRAFCDKCGSALHCCVNCIHYKPGKPNDCEVPGTEYISDRKAMNFCEEFALSGKPPLPKMDPDEVAHRLFGEKSELQKKDPKDFFNSLFSDNEEG